MTSAFSDDVDHFGELSDAAFVREDALAFDFTSRSAITLVIFPGIGQVTREKIGKRVNFWRRLVKRELNQDANVVFVRDGKRGQGVYTANYNGIPGICETPFELANILNDKLYLRGTTRRAVVMADCGGTIPAILTSAVVPYHSLNLFTPYLKVFGSENDFDVSRYSVWKAREHAIWVHDNLTSMRRWFDLTEFLDLYLSAPNANLTMHWAKTLIGTDLLFRELVRRVETRPNVRVVEHDLPPEYDPHVLQRWLVDTRQWYRLGVELLREQFAAEGLLTSPSSV